MNGDQKLWAFGWFLIAALLGWVVWNFTSYNDRSRALEAETHALELSSRPATEEILSCVTRCSESCINEVRPTP